MEFPFDKLFINKEATDDEIVVIRQILRSIDVPKYLINNFLYLHIGEDGTIELLSFDNNYVYIASKELQVTNKMAVQYLKDRDKIDQEVNKLLYWAGLNNIKKYVPVISEETLETGTSKKYANFNVYANSIENATLVATLMSNKDYLYMEDVDA
jgi:hypothetical protein